MSLSLHPLKRGGRLRMTFQTRGDGEGGSNVSAPNGVQRLMSFTLRIIVIVFCALERKSICLKKN